MRAADCHCGQHLEGTDDEELLRLARAHVDTDHPEAELNGRADPRAGAPRCLRRFGGA